MLSRLMLLLLLLGFSRISWGQDTVKTAFSLKDAITYALDHNAQAQNATLDIEKAEKEVNEIRSTGFPQVNGSVNYTHYPALPTNLIPAEFLGGKPGEFAEIQFGTEHNLRANISANQLLFDASFFIGLQQAKLYKDMVEKQKSQTDKEIRTNVTKSYYTALISEQSKAMLKKNLSSVEQLYVETKALYENGFVEEIEVDRLRLSVNNLETQLEAMERQSILALNLLKFQMGLPFDRQIDLTDSLDELFTRDQELLRLDFNYHDRVEYQITEMQTDLTQAGIQYIKSQYYPRANLFATFEETAQRNEFNFTDGDGEWYSTVYWGVSINIPIWDSFLKSAKIQQQEIDLQKLQNTRKQLEYSLQLGVMEARTNYLNALSRFENQKKNIELAEKIFNTAVIKYNEGVGSSLEVSNAESTLFQTMSNYINALYEVLITKTELKRALGKI